MDFFVRTRRTRTEDEYGFNAVIAGKVMRHTDFNQRFPRFGNRLEGMIPANFQCADDRMLWMIIEMLTCLFV